MASAFNLSEIINLIGQFSPVKSLFMCLTVSKQWNKEMSQILETRNNQCLRRIKLYCSVFLSTINDPPKHWLSQRLLDIPQTHDILTPEGREYWFNQYSEVSDYSSEVGPEYGDHFEYDYSSPDQLQKECGCSESYDRVGPICAHCKTAAFIPVMIKIMEDNGCFYYPQFDIICYKCYRKNPMARCSPDGSNKGPEVLYCLDWSDLQGYIYVHIDCT